MGGVSSSANKLKSREVKALVNETNFTEGQIRLIYEKFRSVVGSGRKRMDVNQFQEMFNINITGYALRILTAFGMGNSMSVTFPQFVRGLSMISDTAAIEERVHFIHALFDCDGNGLIDRSEMRELLTFTFSDCDGVMSIPPEEIENLLSSVFNKLDRDGDGFVTYDDLLYTAESNPDLLNFTAMGAQSLFLNNWY